jgi:energy-coupling factor transporter ATP-binding protein EcfA2
MGTALLTAAGLTKSYGSVRALNGFGLSIERGEIVGLIGPNGAGKSTFVAILTALVRPDPGQIRIAGRSPRAARAQVGDITALTISALGGAFAPISTFPPGLAGPARLSPGHWALSLLHAALTGDPAAAIVPTLVLAAITLIATIFITFRLTTAPSRSPLLRAGPIEAIGRPVQRNAVARVAPGVK